MLSVQQYALRYRSLGWSVIPIRAREKRPLLPWQLYQHQLATEDDVEDWFRRWPTANIAVVTGAVSGTIVLDVDPQHDGDASLSRLEKAHGPIPATVEAVTGGGGRHLYFSHPGGTVHNRVGLAEGIDLRGDGGYIVAPPSVHPSGRRYVWKKGRAPGETALASMPEWLLRLVLKEASRSGHPVTHWRRLVREGVTEGQRNNIIASLTGHLLWHGIDPEIALDLLLCWNGAHCHPPLSDDEVAQTVENIARLHLRQEAAFDIPEQMQDGSNRD
jgi:hypothetical protein